MAENVVHGEDLDIFVISLPRSGAPTKDGGVQGTAMLTWPMTPAAAEQIERGLSLLSPQVRRGRPMLWRNGRQLLATKPEEEEERDLLAARAAARDPGDMEAAVEAVQLKTLRRELGADCEAKRRELEALQKAIEEARGRLAKEEERQQKLVADAVAHGQKLVAEAQAHYEARLRATWKTEEDLETHNTSRIQQLGAQIGMATEQRRQIDRISRSASVGEMFGHVKDNVEAIANSPIGQAIGLAAAGKIAAMVSGRISGQTVETEDAMAAIVIEGKKYRLRRMMLLEMKLACPPGNWRGEALVLGAAFCAGEIDPPALAEFIGKGN